MYVKWILLELPAVPDRSTFWSSLVVSFSLLGDTWLYAWLPTQQLFPELWVGFLLSVNRFLRLLLHQPVYHWFRKGNPRTLTLLAALAAVLSTCLYAWGSALWIWILARLIWALAFAVLRLSAAGYAAQGANAGSNLAWSRGLQELGPLLALALGPFLQAYGDPAFTFLSLAAISVIAVGAALRLENLHFNLSPVATPFHWKASGIHRQVFLSAFSLEGVVVVFLGALLLQEGLSPTQVLFRVALYLVLRRMAFLLLAPAAAYLASNWGMSRVYGIATVLGALSLLPLASGYVSWGIPLAFGAYSISAALAPGLSGTTLENLSAQAFWRDAGAALGTLVGGFFISINYFSPLLPVLTFVMLSAYGYWYLHAKGLNTIKTRKQ